MVSTLRQFVLPSLYFGFVLLLGVGAARQGISNYLSGRALLFESESLALTAIEYDPRNPGAYEAYGIVLLEGEDYPRACKALESSSVLHGNNFLIWLRLGSCYRELREFDKAEAAYRKSIALAPHYSRPQFKLGMMYYDAHRYDDAFRHLSKAAQSEPAMLKEVLELARAAFPDDLISIENSVRVDTYEAKKMVARYFIEHDLGSQNVNAFLKSDLVESDKDEFIGVLIGKGRYAAAREVWLSKTNIDITGAGDLVFDGGFERTLRSDDFAFGWKIERELPTVTVSINQEKFHSGQRCVRVKFAGDVNLGQKLVWQLALLAPQRTYSLRFFVRSSEMISAGLPAVVVAKGTSDQVIARSSPIGSTNDLWIESNLRFVAPDDGLVSISLQRPACTENPCPIFGELMLDDVSLTEVVSEGNVPRRIQ